MEYDRKHEAVGISRSAMSGRIDSSEGSAAMEVATTSGDDDSDAASHLEGEEVHEREQENVFEAIRRWRRSWCLGSAGNTNSTWQLVRMHPVASDTQVGLDDGGAQARWVRLGTDGE